MGQARHKGRQTQNGIRTVSNGAPSGTRVNAPPQLTGGERSRRLLRRKAAKVLQIGRGSM